MCSAPPATFPRADGKVKRSSLPEDVYIKKFFHKHPDSKHEDAIKYCLASICLLILCSLFIFQFIHYDMLVTYQYCYKFGFRMVLAVCYWREMMAQIFKCEQQQQQKKEQNILSLFCTLVLFVGNLECLLTFQYWMNWVSV